MLGTGIYQLDPTAYAKPPYGTGDRNFRGSIETTGKFFINQNWKYGWDIAIFSDKYFVQDYNIRANSLGADYIRESISTAYLTGQGDRSYFDLRGYRIQGLSAFDEDKQQPLVLPVLDYNRTLALAPESTERRRRRGQRRLQPHESQPDHGGLPGDGNAAARSGGLLALRCLSDVDDAQSAAAELQAALLLPARHRW